MKRIIIATLALLLFCAVPALSEALPGQPFPDFTVTTTDGDTFTLSDALKDKDMVLINVFATWCPPCRYEFPALREAYEAYADRVAVIVVSGDPDDTIEALAEYKSDNDLPMPFAREEGTGISDFIQLTAFPTSVAVDRFGNISLIHVGAVFDSASFEALFKALTAEDYAETRTFDDMPAPEMDVEYPDAAALSAALNAEGGQLSFECDPDGADYPFVPAERDGRQAGSASNTARQGSAARVLTHVSAQAGDALCFDYLCDVGCGDGCLCVAIDGNDIQRFTGRHGGWETWVLPLTEGEHAVEFRYECVSQTASEASALLDNVRVLSGGDAEAALSAMQVYPVSDRFDVRVVSEGARPGRFTFDGVDISIPFWVVNGSAARIEIDLPAGADPQTAVLYDYNNDDGYYLAALLTEDANGYACEIACGDDTAPADHNLIECYADVFSEDAEVCNVFLFPSEAQIQYIIDTYAHQGYQLEWEYTD